MTRLGHVEIGRHNRRDYRLRYDRLCAVLVVESKARAWHLFIEGEYEGNFPTKREALEHLRKGDV
jgi:hypothetical protein